MMRKRSLYLDPAKWDITLNAAGSIAETTGDYCDAQNVANAVRLFTNDAYLAADKGIPHFEIDLGKRPLEAVLRGRIRGAAVAVENIADAEAVEIELNTKTRELTGLIRVVNEQGAALGIEL